ncbi:RluA family pseudouridine synthase [Thermaerobacter litoralis]
MERLRYVVTTADEGQRLHRLARRWLRHVPLSAVFRLLRQGRITVNGRRAARNAVLRAGDVIEAELDEPAGRPPAQPAAPPRTRQGATPWDGRQGRLDGRTARRPGRSQEAGPPDGGTGTPGPRPVVVYEDEHLLVVDKPAGLLTHGTGRGYEFTLLDWVRDELARRGTLPPGALFQPSPGHRLDRNTSGLVAFGKTRQGAAQLAEWMRSGRAVKEYLAVVRGHPRPGPLQHQLWRDRQRRVTQVVGGEEGDRAAGAGASGPPVSWREGTVPGRTGPRRIGPGPVAGAVTPAGPASPAGAGRGGERPAAAEPARARTARLEVDPVASAGGFTLCRVRLITGRTHQIRAQMAASGHPLAGDRKYGGPRVAGLERPALHCYRLVLPGGIELVAPPPPDLVALCRRLGLPAEPPR